MARTNTPVKSRIKTHEGAPAVPINSEQMLRRSVLSCFLWEKEFYEDGEDIADRISRLASECSPEFVSDLAIQARNEFGLRHAPLLLLEALTKTGKGRMVGDAIYEVIQRADEPAEFLAICKKMGMKTPSKQMKVGLARAIKKFDEYQLAKYNRDGDFKLRDVMFLSHPFTKTDSQSSLLRKLADNELSVPDTWETNLSSGKDKKETFERLLKEEKLGYMALLRNLRNMDSAGVDASLIKSAILARKGAKNVLPFRYVAAARAAPRFERQLDEALIASLEEMEPLSGETLVLVDISASMNARLSSRSDMTRMIAAASLGAIVPGDVRVFSFTTNVKEVPPRKGIAGVDAILKSQPHGMTHLGAAVSKMNRLPHDRLIVVTDEQSQDRVPSPKSKNAYLINVASYKNGVGYERNGWNHIDGFSENVLKYIREIES